MGLDALSSVRTIFAKVDIFIADMISKIYSLILQIADVNIVNEYVKNIIERIYGIIGLFMLFKLALVIINYIVNPDKQQAVGNIVKRAIIALVLIPTVPAIFEKAYELQGIILRDNIIGNIVLGKGNNAIKNDIEQIGNEVSYLVFSNFMDYNYSGDLKEIFSGCPNLFLEEDNTHDVIPVDRCCHPNLGCPTLPKCSYYLLYPTTRDGSYYSAPQNGGNSRDNYYSCKAGNMPEITIVSDWTGYCGIRDGKHIYDLINEARSEKSVAKMLSSEIITSIENDPLFYDGVHGEQCGGPEDRLYSLGDFVFDYDFFWATIIGIIIVILLVVICVDIAIRAIKLSFLQVISPIPIVSYIDVKDSKLFNGWVKETISTYLQLFIRLAIVFFSVLLMKLVQEAVTSNSAIVNIFMVIGILLFSFQMPKLLCDLFNLKDNGFFTLIKNVGKFAIGGTAIGIATVGGATSNLASSVQNIKNSGGAKDVVRNLLKAPGSIVGGGISSGARTIGRLVKNKGSYKKGDVTSSIRESSMNRESRKYGISSLTQDDIKSEIAALETRQKNLENSYEQVRNDLAFRLSNEQNASNIEQAFKEPYENYSDYVSNMTVDGNSSDIINEEKYNEYEKLYSDQAEIEKELDDIEERLALLQKHLKEK